MIARDARHHRHWPLAHHVGIAFVIIALSALVAARAQQPTIPTVSVITAEKRPVTESVLVGRIQAIERVDVRARVTGYLDDVLFKDGDLVKSARLCTGSKRVPLKRRSLLLLTTNRTLIYVNGPQAARTRLGE